MASSRSSSSDFDRMLSAFKEAAGAATTTVNAKASASSNNSTQNNDTSSLSLKENIERLWNTSLLRKKFQQHQKQVVVPPPSSSSSVDTNKEEVHHHHIHVAVCACIVDSLPHEHIWRSWIDTTTTNNSNTNFDYKSSQQKPTITPITTNNNNNDNNNYNNDGETITTSSTTTISYSADMYIHAKFPNSIQSKWVRQNLISRSFHPNWNDVRIVQAMLALAEEALVQQPITTHILFCTESCIPISSLQDTVRMLLLLPPTNSGSNNNGNNTFSVPSSSCCCSSLEKSFLNAYNSSDSTKFTRFDERSCWSKLSNVIPYEAIWKALPGWCVISKAHMTRILDMPSRHLGGKDLYPIFEHVWAPEEVFFPTALSLLGLLPNPDVIHQRSLVYSKFIRGQPHPMEYDLRNQDVVDQLCRILKEEGRHKYNNCSHNNSDSNTIVEGYITLRKVKHPIDVNTWEQIISKNSSSASTPDKGDSHSSMNEAYYTTSATVATSTRRRQNRSDDEETGQAVVKRGRL
jgi:hypothetical protein